MAYVRLRGITKIFGGHVQAVKSVDLDIYDKEFLVMVGPSGCGKSTTLRMIAGLEAASSGEIYIGETHVNHIPPKDRDIAMVFQNYALYPHMTVFENMAFGLKLRKIPKNEINQRVNDAADILSITPLLTRKPKELSGGQRQRVALGRAIVRKPQVFLFDEPLSNLDAKMRVQMRTELNKLHTRLQATMIYVTHDQTEAMTMGDRIAVMKAGVIQQIADPISLYDYPVNKFVAGFIGTPPMNFITGKIIRKNGGKLYFDEGKFKVKLVDEMVKTLKPYEGKKVVFGLRAEDIYDKLFVSEAPPENVVTVTVDVVEPMGSDVFIYLTTGQNTFTARVGGHQLPEVQQQIDLVFDMSKAHFFDVETEQAIISRPKKK